jgi:hypothetical protein
LETEIDRSIKAMKDQVEAENDKTTLEPIRQEISKSTVNQKLNSEKMNENILQTRTNENLHTFMNRFHQRKLRTPSLINN